MSEDNLWELIFFSFAVWVSCIELSVLGLAARAFPTEPSCVSKTMLRSSFIAAKCLHACNTHPQNTGTVEVSCGLREYILGVETIVDLRYTKCV
uniref:Uncharacterized protein n=1 Tax=Peromyscus maniculatus bairdii TaxID=230844 RepID=A0A8C8UJX8_PERMB